PDHGPCGARLRGHERLAEEGAGDARRLAGAPHELYAPRLPASAGVDLRLDDSHGDGKLREGGRRVLGARGGPPAGDGKARLAEERLRLELVELHRRPPRTGSAGSYASRPLRRTSGARLRASAVVDGG